MGCHLNKMLHDSIKNEQVSPRNAHIRTHQKSWDVTSMRRSTIGERNKQILSTKTQAHTSWHNTTWHGNITSGANSFARGANGIVGVHLNRRVVANSDKHGGQWKIGPIILQCSQGLRQDIYFHIRFTCWRWFLIWYVRFLSYYCVNYMETFTLIIDCLLYLASIDLCWNRCSS